MICIGGSVEVQRALGWRKRKLWVHVNDAGIVYTLYVKRGSSGVFMYSDGLLSGGLGRWRNLRLPEQWRYYQWGAGRVVHVFDIVAAAKQSMTR